MALKILVNNTRKRVIVPMGDKTPSVVLMPSGDITGGDMVPIDTSAAESSSVYQAVRTGKVSVRDSDEDMSTLLAEREQALSEKRDEAAGKTAEAVESVMERTQDRDLVGSECIAPSAANPNLPCGASVVRPNAVNGAEPPLCSRHASMAGQYVATEVGPKEGALSAGPAQTQWTRIAGLDKRAAAL